MDHAMKTMKILDSLGLESLKGSTPEQLYDAIDVKFPEKISKEEVVHVYMAWLNEHLHVVDSLNGDASSEDLLRWRDAVTRSGLGSNSMLNELCVWRQAQIEIEPSCARRLDLLELELRTILGQGSPTILVKRQAIRQRPSSSLGELNTGKPHHAASSCQNRVSLAMTEESTYGQMHPDRVKIASGSSSTQMVTGNTFAVNDNSGKTVIEISTDDFDLKHGDRKPNRDTNRGSLSGTEITAFNDDTSGQSAGQAKKGEKKKAKKKKKAEKKGETKKVKMMKRKGGQKTAKGVSRLVGDEEVPDVPPSAELAFPHKITESTANEDTSFTPPKGYICDRCGFLGHFKADCPTNLDPTKDKRPMKGYQCNICKSGDHFISMCPNNKDPSSITQQRLRAVLLRNQESGGKAEGRDGRGHARHIEKLRGTLKDFYRPSYGGSRSRQQNTFRRERSNSPKHETGLMPPSNRSHGDDYEHRSSRVRSPPGQCSNGKPPRRLREDLRPDRAPKRQWDDGIDAESESTIGSRDAKRVKKLRAPEDGPDHIDEGRLTPYNVQHSPADTERRMHRSPSDNLSGRPDFSEADGFLGGFQSLALNPKEHKLGYDLERSSPDGVDMLLGDMTSGHEACDDEDTDMKELSPPVEFGVTVKPLERDTPYHPIILKLFQNKGNVWINRVKRTPAADFWRGDDQRSQRDVSHEGQ